MQKERLITDNTEIQRIIREYCEHYMLRKWTTLDEMDRHLEQPPKTKPERNSNYEEPSYKH